MKDKKYIINKILPMVKKPSSYIGNEINSIHKEISKEMVHFAFAFPDIYEVGMSHLGLKILYSLLNKQDDVWCERVFAPWLDMEEQLKANKIELFSMESMTPINQFSMIGFTLQYEMSYTNILNMLELGNVPLLSKDRTMADPFVLAGGPGVYNPEPLSDFFDFFVIGEAEEIILEVIKYYKKWLNSGTERIDFLKQISNLEGIYVPSFYEVEYKASGEILEFKKVEEVAQLPVKKRFIKNIENVDTPETFIVPYTETIHDRAVDEIFRGCGRGCRFCQAGMIYRPTREKSINTIEQQVENILKTTGYDEISLASLSTGDYSQIEKLVGDLVEKYKDDEISVSLPSLRIDSLSIDMLEEIQKIKKTGITLAPEAGTQRMRDVINKGVTERDLIETVTAAFKKGWGHIKLYFVIGLPSENEEDILAIAELGKKVVESYCGVEREFRNKTLKVVLSTSCFVPKAFTPFQWMGQNTIEEFHTKQKNLKNNIKDRKITYNWHEASLSILEAVFARGDRKLGKVLLKAHEMGCKFDSWAEVYDKEKWKLVFEETGIDPNFYALRNREFDEVLPWDFIDIGIKKSYLQKEYEKAMNEETTPCCKEKCSDCGIMEFSKGYKCRDQYQI